MSPTSSSDYFTENATNYGGLIEFYRSPAACSGPRPGPTFPTTRKLAQLWWENIAPAAAGEVTAQEAMDALAEAQDDILSRLERGEVGGDCAPLLNEEQDAQFWLDEPGAPVPALENEDEEPVTVGYDELLATWEADAPDTTDAADTPETTGAP